MKSKFENDSNSNKKLRFINEDKVVNLFHNPKFLSNFEKINTEDEILQIFNKNNIHITEEDLETLHDICEKYVNRGMEITDEEKILEEVSSGSNNCILNDKYAAEKIVDILSPDCNKYDIKKNFSK